MYSMNMNIVFHSLNDGQWCQWCHSLNDGQWCMMYIQEQCMSKAQFSVPQVIMLPWKSTKLSMATRFSLTWNSSQRSQRSMCVWGKSGIAFQAASFSLTKSELWDNTWILLQILCTLYIIYLYLCVDQCRHVSHFSIDGHWDLFSQISKASCHSCTVTTVTPRLSSRTIWMIGTSKSLPDTWEESCVHCWFCVWVLCV